MGQVLLLAAMPILTRLFTPEAFGLFGVLAAINGIFGLVMSGRYEFGIPLADSNKKAAALIVLGTIVVAGLSLVSFLIVWAFGAQLAAATEMHALNKLLWLVPLILLITGLGQPFEYLSIRRETMRLNGLSRFAQLGGQAVFQTLFGLLGAGPLGLTIGYAAGYLGRLCVLATTLPKSVWSEITATQFSEVRSVARAFRRYPAYSMPSSLLRSATQFSPTIVLAVIYGPGVAGGFDLAQRILTVPVRLISSGASQVFLAETAHRDPSGVRQLFRQTVPRFLVVGIVGMAPIFIAGPFLFATIFGEPWREAGSFAQALAALQLSRFVSVPVSQVFNIFQRQDLDLQSSLLNALAIAAAFAVVVAGDYDPISAVLAYSLASAISQIALLGFAWYTVQRAILPQDSD